MRIPKSLSVIFSDHIQILPDDPSIEFPQSSLEGGEGLKGLNVSFPRAAGHLRDVGDEATNVSSACRFIERLSRFSQHVRRRWPARRKKKMDTVL
jgi:hypothetical protein